MSISKLLSRFGVQLHKQQESKCEHNTKQINKKKAFGYANATTHKCQLVNNFYDVKYGMQVSGNMFGKL